MAGNGTVKLDPQKIEDSIGVLLKQTNGEVLDRVKDLAEVLKNSGDTNEVVDQMLQVAIKFQSQYNEYADSVSNFINVAGDVYDIGEYMQKKASVGEIQNRDLSFETKKIDKGVIMQ